MSSTVRSSKGTESSSSTISTRILIFQLGTTYGTSGTRPLLRFFGGWEYDANICDTPNVATHGYEHGVPMGGDLAAAPSADASPRFVVAAIRDASADAGPLERIEIIKGWVEDGERKERVVLAAGGPNGSSVDLGTCERQGQGATRLCSVWTDPDFDPAEPAFYYARLLENPSCRYTAYTCNAATGDTKPGFCDDGTVELQVQDRAWGSPIWVTPAGSIQE